MKGGGFLGGYGGEAAFAAMALALAAGTALAAAGGFWAWREITDQQARYDSYRDLQRNAGRADSLSSAYEALDRDLEALRKALPPENQSSHVLNVLVEEARSRNLGIGALTAMDEVPFPGYSELPFEMKVSGAFPDLVRYFHALETRGLAVQVRKAEVRSEGLGKSRVQARLELSVFSPGAGAGP